MCVCVCVCVWVCVYKDDLALNNLQWLICHKTKPNRQSKVDENDDPCFFRDVKTEAEEEKNEG